MKKMGQVVEVGGNFLGGWPPQLTFHQVFVGFEVIFQVILHMSKDANNFRASRPTGVNSI